MSPRCQRAFQKLQPLYHKQPTMLQQHKQPTKLLQIKQPTKPPQYNHQILPLQHPQIMKINPSSSRSVSNPLGVTSDANSSMVKKNINPIKSNINKSNQLNCVNFFYSNATSLVKKCDQFNSILNFHSLPHIVMVTETWFNETSLTILNDYNSFLKIVVLFLVVV